MNRNKVIVTGASGYIGNNFKDYVRLHVSSEIAENFKFLSRSELDITDIHAVECLVEEGDLIVHLACLDNKRSAEGVKDSFFVNSFGTEVIARVARNKSALLLMVSTSEVLSIENQNEDITSDRYNYARHKIYSENIVSTLCLPGAYKILRLFSVYGGLNSKSVVDIFRRNAVAGKQVTIDNPSATRDFVSINDVCRMILALSRDWDYLNESITNFGSGIHTRLDEITRVLSAKYEYDLQINLNYKPLEINLAAEINHIEHLENLEDYLNQ